jgi:hypothetical protein
MTMTQRRHKGGIKVSRLLLLITGGAILLSAQTPVGGPSMGFVFDPSGHALRPILGIPGASIFGDPLQTSAPVVSAALSLRQNVAVVNDGTWKAVGLTASASATAALPDGLPANPRVVVSESGTAAAFYDSDNNVLSMVTGILSPAMASGPVGLDALPGAITAFAAADDGSLLVSASIDGGGEALFWIGQDGSARQLATLQAAASILLWNHGANALVVDRAANQIWKIQDPGGNAAITLMASDADGVSSPSGAALSADGNKLWIANSGNRNVLGIDTRSRVSVSLNCGCDITTLVPMADSQTFRLNQPHRGPLWLLDTSPGVDPRVIFTPAAHPARSTEEDAQ